MAREINLVPEVKEDMIKTLKLRNFIFFLCIVVSAASIGIATVTGFIAGGQGLIIDNNKEVITSLSSKINNYSDIKDFLTVKNQLGDIELLTSDRNVASRTFNILSAILPTGADTVEISELNVNLEGTLPYFAFDAQANANSEPYIDYNVLDSFKKSMQYMRYDYGNYVDRNGNAIPAYCVIDSTPDGTIFKEGNNYYGLWTIDGEGCNPSEDINPDSYQTEEYQGERVVRIWRTPRFDEWYKETATSDQPYMTLDGEIANVEHFVSACNRYKGTKDPGSGKIKWDYDNDCQLVPDTIDPETGGGIIITDSSNGRDDDEQLVLRFSAMIYFAPEVYKFTNHHMIALPPKSQHNVTDSYVQIKDMFAARAKDCAADDAACGTNNNTSENN